MTPVAPGPGLGWAHHAHPSDRIGPRPPHHQKADGPPHDLTSRGGPP